MPEKLKAEVSNLSDVQLDTPYRPEGWTVRQVIHHLPDSHMNSYLRFKWAMTEEAPTIKAYHEDRWAETEDGQHGPIEFSLDLLTALHNRWAFFLNSLSEEDWQRRWTHPETGKVWTLARTLSLYAWHSNHHLTHITELKKRKGW